MKQDLRDSFRALFEGSKLSHVQVLRGKIAATRDFEAPTEAWDSHFDGDAVLGMVPVREKSQTCLFAAIDLDYYDEQGQKTSALPEEIQHVFQKIDEHELPLTPFRSRHGSLHLYTFIQEPGQLAKDVRKILSTYVLLLGHTQKPMPEPGERFCRAEIFPKQEGITEESKGSCIFLPYYKGEERPALKLEDGKITEMHINEFLQGVRIKQKITAAKTVSNYPPCLDALLDRKLKENQGRNNMLMNVAVLHRKMDSPDWKDHVMAYNQTWCDPPLSHSDVNSTIASAAKTTYSYLCQQAPINSYCDRETCLQRKFGVSFYAGDERFDEWEVTSMLKIMTEPPVFQVSINDVAVSMDASEVMNIRKFRDRVWESTSLIIPPMKQLMWEGLLTDLKKRMIEVEAPEDASISGQIISFMHGFLQQRDKADSINDIETGIPYEEAGVIYFIGQHFLNYISNFGFQNVQRNKIFAMLQQRLGISSISKKVRGGNVRVWTVPSHVILTQVEPHAKKVQKAPSPF